MKSTPPPPPPAPIRVLIVDDEPAMRRTLARTLQTYGFKVESQEDGEAALGLMASLRFDVLLADVNMPGMDGLALLERVKQEHPDVEVVMLTGQADITTAVASLRLGAYHFLTKSADSEEVRRVIEMAAERKRLVDLTRQLEERLDQLEAFGELVGSSPKMREVYRLARGVAETSTTVLILGENGTGKELVARAIHRHGARGHRPFLAVNCGAIPENLVESELFGSVKGAFSEATNKPGLFELADGGTLFLDEIGDLPLAAQVKLLRALQEGEIRRLGATESKRVDVRVIAATNVDLKTRITEMRFREDLYFRLCVFPIRLPPLRQRKDDIPALAYHLLRKHAAQMGRDVKHISTEAMRRLREQPWPGNVRELGNAVERAVVMTRSDTIVPRDLAFGDDPSDAEGGSREGARFPADLEEMPYAQAKFAALDSFDKRYVEALLERFGGNVTHAAEAAGMDRSNFRRLVKKVRGNGGGDDRGVREDQAS